MSTVAVIKLATIIIQLAGLYILYRADRKLKKNSKKLKELLGDNKTDKE